MANSNQVATLATTELVQILGEQLQVMKSDKAKRYPLYLKTTFGPWPLNTQKAQDFLLEHATFAGAGAAQDPAANAPAAAPDLKQERDPAPENPVNAPGTDDSATDVPRETPGIGKAIDEFFNFD